MYEFNYLYITILTTILLKGSLLLKSTMINLRWLLTFKLGTLVGGHQKNTREANALDFEPAIFITFWLSIQQKSWSLGDRLWSSGNWKQTSLALQVSWLNKWMYESWYCWWKKSCTSWYGKSHIIHLRWCRISSINSITCNINMNNHAQGPGGALKYSQMLIHSGGGLCFL